MLLYKNLKALLHKDQTALRQSIIKYYKDHSNIIKLASIIYNHNPDQLKFIWGCIYACRHLFFHFSLPTNSNEIFFGTRKNEIKALQDHFGQGVIIASGKFLLFPNLVGVLRFWDGRFIKKLGSFIRITSMIAKKNDLIVFLRTVDYLVFSQTCKVIQTNHFIHSSEGDPLVNALCSQVKKQGGTVTFVDHGLIPLPFSLFPFDHIITTNYRNFKKLKSYFPHKSISFEGVRHPTAGLSMNLNRKKIGIIDSLTTEPSQLNFLIKKINLEFPQFEIIVRYHPNRNIPFAKNLKVQAGEHLEFDECLFVFAGNTGHAVKILAKGIPVLYDCSLDRSPYDLYFLVRDDILLELDVHKPIDLGNIADFYSTDKWIKNWNCNF